MANDGTTNTTAAVSVNGTKQLNGKPKASRHPLDPLTGAEISATSKAVLKYLVEHVAGPKAFKIVYVTLHEPQDKIALLRYLGIPTCPEEVTPGGFKPDKSVSLARCAETCIINAASGLSYVVRSTLDESLKVTIDDFEQLEEHEQPAITVEELFECETVIRADPKVQQLCRDVGFEPDQLFVDGWAIGITTRFEGIRLQQGFCYFRVRDEGNFYAHPADFVPVIDSNAMKVIHIDFPTQSTSQHPISSAGTTAPPSLDQDALKAAGRDRIAPPMQPFDYLPGPLLADKQSGFKYRDDIKPLHVVQPEGVSFKIDGHHVSWQKWDFHIGFNWREGVTLNTVTYNDDGTIRPLYRSISIADMVVPYGEPAWPAPRKCAFDSSEYGMGTVANSLSLGCDCLGTIQYLDTVCSDHAGNPVTIKNAVCIHEEDAGLLWKHSDLRPGGKAHATRARKLVVSFVCTVANYEYSFGYELLQDGTLTLVTKLTGMLNIYVLAEGEKAGAHGVEVAPRLNAHHHQHLFSLRIDPMIDGIRNSVVETDIVPMKAKTGSKENYFGNGWTSEKTLLKTTKEGVRDADFSKSRSWSMIQPGKTHYSSKQPVGWKIMCKDIVPLLAQPDSLVATRAPFAKHSLWVTPNKPDRQWPAGKWATQSMVTPKDTVQAWVEGDQKIDDEDILIWLTFGTSHIARPEDFPVMPVEHLSVTLKPVGFFNVNPALDVPSTIDAKSRLHEHGSTDQLTAAQDSSNGHAVHVDNACCA